MGLDGETKVMDSPLRFSIRPTPVRVRLPKHAIGYSPAARSLGWRESLRDWGVVVGDRALSGRPPVSDAPDRTPTASAEPPEARLAQLMEARPTPRRSVAAQALHELAEVDLAVYRAIAGTPTPTLDEPLRRLSGLANHSKLWVDRRGGAVRARADPEGEGRRRPGSSRWASTRPW